MRALIIFFMIASIMVSSATAQDNASKMILSLIDTADIPPDVTPAFICGDFALVKKTEIVEYEIESREVLPEIPGDYYVMRILDREKLDQLKDRLPYILIGEHAIFRTDPAGAELLPAYGWGLTRISLTARKMREKPIYPPVIEVSYDPDIASMIAEITPQSCESTLVEITSFATRYSYTSGCRQAEDTVYHEFNDIPLTPSYFDFSLWGTDMRNVIGELPGTVAPESVIIVCGHLDCVSEDPYNYAPGAEDNGSGTVSVLEAARVLSQYQPELTIRFITFSGEEQGLIGSDEYADSMQTAGENITAVINLDMVAYRGSFANDMYIFSDSLSHWLGSLAAEVMDLYTDVDTVTAYEDEPRYGSDHYSFAIRGYPAVFFIDAWHGPDWYPYYHTTADTIGNLDMNLLASVTRTGAAMAAILARVDFEANPIPTLSEWGMLIMALVLLLAATIGVIRRRRPVRARSYN